MKCVRCKKECLNDELINGYCYDCRKYLGVDEKNISSLKYNSDVTNEVGSKISVASSIIKYSGMVSSVIGAIVYICEFKDSAFGVVLAIVLGFIGIIVSYFIGLLLDGLAEILNLLENIKNK